MKLTPEAQAFLHSVLAARPQLAVFDCDGTLWNFDAGEGFLYWEMEQGLLPPKVADWARARYQEYRAGRVGEEPMCGEMVTIHEGLDDATLAEAAGRYFREFVMSWIFPEMTELLRRLHAGGCDVWLVSSTNDWVINAAAQHFGIPLDRVLAAAVYREGGRATGRLLRVPTDELKATAIREVIRRVPDAVFGNSMHDAAMLEMAKNAYAINPNPDLEQVARERGWTVYQPKISD